MASDQIQLKSLCIYCYKPSLEENSPLENSFRLKSESQGHKIFTKLIARHLKLNSKNTAYLENCSPRHCNDCLGIVNRFCELYHQLKCLELQLNWQVDKLWNVMRWADRVPSRLKSFRNTENFESKLEFRKFFKRKCKQHFSHQSPRLILPVTLPVSVKSKTEIQAATVIGWQSKDVVNTEVGFTGHEIECDQNKDKDKDKKTEYISLGWISSLAALIFLYHLGIPDSQIIEDDVIVEPIECLNAEPRQLAQVIVESERIVSPEPIDCDDVASSNDYDELQLSPFNSSTNHENFEEEPFTNRVDDGPVPEETPISEIIVPTAAPTVPLFIVEETSQLLSSDFNVECGSASPYEVPVRITETQPFSNQENGAPDHSEESVTPTPVAVESHNAPNVEIGDVKLAFSSTPLEVFDSTNVRTTSVVLPVVPSSSSLHHKRVATDGQGEEAPVLGRRSLRTKFQCSKCKATFSNVKRFENHSNSCRQASGIESEIDSEEQEEEAVVKIDVDMQPDYQESDESPTNEGKIFQTNSQRRSTRRATRKTINYANQGDNDWKTDAGAKYKSESSSSTSSSGNESSGEEINYQVDTETNPARGRHIPSCTKCDLTFTSRTRFILHENYKHSKSLIDSYDVGRMHLTRSSLKLEGISLETCFECTLDPDQCTRKYPLAKELEKHSKLHGQFTCPICDLSVTDALDLVDHEVEHTNEQQLLKDKSFKKGEVYHCARCDYKAAVSQEMVNHYLSGHLGLPEIEAECPICQQRFPCSDTVPLTHYLNYHDLNRLDEPGDRVTCNEADCHAYFLREDQLHKHWTTEHTNMEIKFAEVRKQSKQKIYINRQKLEKTYAAKCPHCSRTFACGRNLKTHISNYHVKKSWKKMGARVISKNGLTVDDWVFEKKAKHFCKVNDCKEKFREEEAFQTHSKLHGEFPCKFCKVVKTFAGELAIHEMLHVDKLAEVKTISDPERMRFRCSRCPFRTGRKDRHVEHFVWKHLGLLVERKKCPICKHGFKTSYKYKNSTDMVRNLKPKIYHHFVDWHEFSGVEGGESGAFKCDKCPAYFRTSLQLMQHTDEVHDSPGHNMEEIEGMICKDCGMGLSSVKSLRMHRAGVHKIELKFACDVPDCGEKYETARLLINHHSVFHSGNSSSERTFNCEQCEKKFFLKSALCAHIKCHEPKPLEPAKRHVCERCGKSFKQRNHLEVHYKFHDGPESWDFACELCGKKIYSQQKLTEHMRVHTKEKPFKCQVCGMAYGHRHNLRIHVNSKHKEIQDVAKQRDTTNFASSRKGKKIK